MMFLWAYITQIIPFIYFVLQINDKENNKTKKLVQLIKGLNKLIFLGYRDP